MNKVKLVHTKETLMTSNDITEAITQKQSNGKMLQKYGAHPQRNTHADMQIQSKPGGNNNEITGPHRRSPLNFPIFFMC